MNRRPDLAQDARAASRQHALKRAALGLCVTSLTLAGTAAAAVAAPQLPEGRAYELVSAGDKLANQVDNNSSLQLLADGNTAIFLSAGSFDGSHVNSATNQYVGRRGASGWSTRAMEPALPAGVTPPRATAQLDYSADGAYYFFSSPVGYDAADTTADDLYRSDGSAIPLWLTTNGLPKVGTFRPQLAGIGADGTTSYFHTEEVLDSREADATSGRITGRGLYRKTGAGLQLVAVDDDGALLNRCGALPAGGDLNNTGRTNVVSDDGSIIFFTTGTNGDPSCDPATEEGGQLYARIGNERTVLVSPTRRAADDPDPGGRRLPSWIGATPDGSRVFFTSEELLTDDATARNALYAFDLPTAGDPDGTLQVLTPTVEGGGTDAAVSTVVLGFSDDGTRLYFTSSAQLTADAPVAGTKVYLWDDGDLRYVTDQALSYAGTNIRTVSVSPDGSKLTYLSSTSLPGGYNSAGRTEAYLFDATGSTGATGPICVSCNPRGDAALSNAAFHPSSSSSFSWSWRNRERMVTDDGRVVFQTTDPLVFDDANGRVDVYIWLPAEGSARLITTGAGTADAGLAGISADGRSVGFSSLESLTWQDTDNGDRDFYVARIGGGVAQPKVSDPCSGDACQGNPTPPPTFGDPATALFVGPDDVDDPELPLTKPVFAVGAIGGKQQRTWAKTGSTTLTVQVSEGGSVSAAVRARIGKRTLVVSKAKKTAADGGSVKLKLRLSKAARRQLARRGKLKLSIRVSYSKAATKSTTLTLKRAARRGNR